MITPVAGRGPSARAFRFHNVSKRQQRLAMVLVLVVLIVTVVGILLVEASRTPSITPGSDVLSVAQHTPTSSATRQTPPTQTLPSPTPTKPAPTPTPRPPTPTPIPPTPTVICPNGSAFCVSTVQLQVPCAGEGSVTFQLMSNTRHSENWQAVSMLGGSLVTISPAFGTLKENQAVTISVLSNTNHAHEGTIMIVGPFGTSPVSVTAQVCSD